MNRLTDAQICPAATEIAVHRCIDLGIARIRILRQQRRRRHDLARLTVAALRHIHIHPGLLHRVAAIAGEPFNGSDSLSRHAGDRRDARSRTATPSMCTVQAPHTAMPQPYFVPRRLSESRTTHNRGMSGGTSTVVDWPFTVSLKLMALPPERERWMHPDLALRSRKLRFAFQHVE